jgi:CheY-like chemotaxis protein
MPIEKHESHLNRLSAAAPDKPLILLVEEEGRERHAIAKKLMESGFDVIQAIDDYTAIQSVKEDGRTIAAVVTDTVILPSNALKDHGNPSVSAYFDAFEDAAKKTSTRDAGIVFTQMIRDGAVEGIAPDVPIVLQSTAFSDHKAVAEIFGPDQARRAQERQDELQDAADQVGVNRTASKKPDEILRALRELGIAPAQQAAAHGAG